MTQADETLYGSSGIYAADPAIRHKSGRNKYDVDGVRVEVSWKEFLPIGAQGVDSAVDAQRVLFFFPGWGYTEQASPTEELSQALADYSHRRVYAVDMYTERCSRYSLTREADAARMFIDETSAMDKIVVGHSQGGWASIYIAATSQNICGLILLDSMGIYTRELGDFLIDYVAEQISSGLLADYPPLPKLKMRALRAANSRYMRQGVVEVFRQIRLAGGVPSYLSRLYQEVQEMLIQNPRSHEVTVPVVVINGDKDRLSQPHKIIPSVVELGKTSYIRSAREREAYLRAKVFPASPYVKMLVAAKMGYHGLFAFRPRDVARVSLYLLERGRKEEPYLFP